LAVGFIGSILGTAFIWIVEAATELSVDNAVLLTILGVPGMLLLFSLARNQYRKSQQQSDSDTTGDEGLSSEDKGDTIIVGWKEGFQLPQTPYRESWNNVNSFTLWQVAWLWEDFEPIQVIPVGTPAYPIYRMLLTDHTAGVLPAWSVDSTRGSRGYFIVNRMQLVTYAKRKKLGPRFLFD